MSQTETDLRVIANVIRAVGDRKLLFCEIGVFGGATARFVKSICEQYRLDLDYWGVDNASHPNFVKAGTPPQSPFEGAHMVIGDSAEVFMHVPDGLDIVLVDGDHGGNAVILDTILYGGKVRRGGFMLFHDTAPHIQQTMREQHGPDHPWFYNSVLDAHAALGFPTEEWVLWMQDYDPNAPFGGMTAYQRI